MVYPLPVNLIREFASKVKKIYVVEELDPFFEEQIRALGIDVVGKEIFPYTNEFDPGVVETAIMGEPSHKERNVTIPIPVRPPNLCPGCPHRGLFYVLGRLDTFVAGDIGCYTLSFMKPLEGMDSCICMGASIGMAHGMSQALREKGKGKIVGVIGDSTFIHSGITSLLNTAYNKSNVVIVIADNRTTAMTGMQNHPATGTTLQGRKTKELNFTALGTALGIESIRTINPFNIKETRTIMKEELSKDGPSLVLSSAPCALLRSKQDEKVTPLRIDPDKCTGCKLCLRLGCPAISWKNFEDLPDTSIQKKTKKQEGIATIDSSLCNGCTLCEQLCNFGSIEEVQINE